MRSIHKRHARQNAAALLSIYLPDNGRSPGERLQAITGTAFIDGAPRIERRLARPLSDEEREDAKATLVLVGLECVQTYNPSLDKGTGTVPLNLRFGRFVYLRARLKLIDWERKTFGDRRPGRTRRPETVPYDDELDHAEELALDDLHADRAQVAAWARAAAFAGVPLSAWIERTLDAAAAGFSR